MGGLIVGLLVLLAVAGGMFLVATILAVVIPTVILIVLGVLFLVIPIAIALRILRWGIRH